MGSNSTPLPEDHERARKALPCTCGTETRFTPQYQFHDDDCPAYHRKGVAEEFAFIREQAGMGMDRDWLERVITKAARDNGGWPLHTTTIIDAILAASKATSTAVRK